MRASQPGFLGFPFPYSADFTNVLVCVLPFTHRNSFSCPGTSTHTTLCAPGASSVPQPCPILLRGTQGFWGASLQVSSLYSRKSFLSALHFLTGCLNSIYLIYSFQS